MFLILLLCKLHKLLKLLLKLSCENFRKEAKVESIPHLDILNHDCSDNVIKPDNKDRVICDCGEKQEFTIITAVQVLLIYLTTTTS